MSNIDDLVLRINYVADKLTGPDAEFKIPVADRLLRNIEVATLRILPFEFVELSPVTIDKVLDAASDAKEIAPLEEVALFHSPHETDDAYGYRVTIHAPFDSLKKKVAENQFDLCDPEQERKLKAAVKLSSEALELLVSDSSGNDSLHQSENYFWDNIAVAVSSLSR